jgi:hypothetical protein
MLLARRSAGGALLLQDTGWEHHSQRQLDKMQ